MTYTNENIAALLGSRICHDLISPIGAINNGLELLALSDAPQGMEMDLVSESAASADARIRLFRLAFGVATPDQMSRAEEITSIWSAAHPDGRITLTWSAHHTLSRGVARLVVLACLCAELALPHGGQLRVTDSDDGWTIHAAGPRLNVEAALWAGLSDPANCPPLQPSQVQFALLPRYAAELGHVLRVETSQTHISLSL